MRSGKPRPDFENPRPGCTMIDSTPATDKLLAFISRGSKFDRFRELCRTTPRPRDGARYPLSLEFCDISPGKQCRSRKLIFARARNSRGHSMYETR